MDAIKEMQKYEQCESNVKTLFKRFVKVHAIASKRLSRLEGTYRIFWVQHLAWNSLDFSRDSQIENRSCFVLRFQEGAIMDGIDYPPCVCKFHSPPNTVAAHVNGHKVK